MAKYKAGQIITIEGKRYRVTKLHKHSGCCIFCGFRFKEDYEYPCSDCIDGVPSLIPHNCYFKEINRSSHFREI